MTKELTEPEKLAKLVQKEQGLILGECDPEDFDKKFFLIAIDKNGVMVTRNFTNSNLAIETAKVYWTKGFLVVNAFYFSKGENSTLIQTIYWGLRNW